MNLRPYITTLTFAVATSGIAQEVIRIPVSEFDPSQLEENTEDPKWSVLKLPGRDRTTYTVGKDERGAHILASSQNSASGLVYAVDIDPSEYTTIEWSWKVDGVIEKGDLKKKKGDDYPARIYLTFEYELSRLSFIDRIKYTLIKTFTSYEIPLRSLNYVWANKAPQGTIAPNPYTDWVYMIATQSGNENAGKWQIEMSNLLEDYRNAFNEEPMNITGVAIMTDTDNTKGTARGNYGDIIFRKEPVKTTSF
jgi:hypothetical protein